MTTDPQLDAATQPVKKPLPVANAPTLPGGGASTGSLPAVPTTPVTPPQPAIPAAGQASSGGTVGAAIPTAPGANTADPLAFAPNPGFTPPGGYGTNTAAPSANGDPAAPPGTFDAFHKAQADAAAALKNGPVPNAGGGYRDFTQTATGTAPTVSDAVGQASLHQNAIDDATAQVPTNAQGAIFSDTQRPGVTMTGPDGKPVVPGGSSQDWINAHVATAGANGGGPSNTVTPTDSSTLTRSIAPPVGPASDVGAGGQQPPNPSTVGGVYTPDPIEQAIGAASANSTNPGASTLTPVTPDTALTNFRISAGPQTDRVKTFQDATNSTIKNVIDPAYDASARDLNRYNFGAGRGISGAARTSQGDLANQREQRIADLSAQGLANATTGSIDDAYRNIGIDMDEQKFQAGQQQTGFNQNLALQELSNAQTQAEFDRALQKLIVGSQGDPAAMEAWIASIYGGQSAQSAEAATHLAGV